MASYAPLDTDETGAAGGTMLIFFMSSTSPRLEVGTCANGWDTICQLLIGRGRFVVAAFCLGALAINGDFRLCCTSLVNHVRCRAASTTTQKLMQDIWKMGSVIRGRVAGPTWSRCRVVPPVVAWLVTAPAPMTMEGSPSSSGKHPLMLQHPESHSMESWTTDNGKIVLSYY
jgi:hypothetical protein